jgi:hypothetical protein
LIATGIAIGVIAGAGALIYLTHVPVAQFLANVALCTTEWNQHGQCPWFKV